MNIEEDYLVELYTAMHAVTVKNQAEYEKAKEIHDLFEKEQARVLEIMLLEESAYSTFRKMQNVLDVHEKQLYKRSENIGLVQRYKERNLKC